MKANKIISQNIKLFLQQQNEKQQKNDTNNL